jgi:hypothetical protein
MPAFPIEAEGAQQSSQPGGNQAIDGSPAANQPGKQQAAEQQWLQARLADGCKLRGQAQRRHRHASRKVSSSVAAPSTSLGNSNSELNITTPMNANV